MMILVRINDAVHPSKEKEDDMCRWPKVTVRIAITVSSRWASTANRFFKKKTKHNKLDIS